MPDDGCSPGALESRCACGASPGQTPFGALDCAIPDRNGSLVARVDINFQVTYASCGWGAMLQGVRSTGDMPLLERIAMVLEPVRKVASRAFASGRRRKIDWTTPALGERALRTEAVPELDAAGAVVRVLLLTTDRAQQALDETVLAEDAERFRLLNDLSTDWYWEQDSELRFINPHGECVYALLGQDIVGKRRWELPIVGVTDAQWAKHKRTLNNRRPFQDFVFRIVVNGVERKVSVSGTPVFDAAGIFQGYRGVGREITHEDVLRDALELSEKRLRLAVEYGRIGLWDRDLYSGKIYWSANVAPMLGLPSGLRLVEIETFLARIHPEDAHYREILELGAHQGAFDIEHRVLWPDGTVRWMRQRGDVVRGRNGMPRRIVGIIQDITVWKDQENRRLQSALRQRDALVREVHHRIKNSLQGVALLLRRHLDTVGQADTVHRVIAQVQAIATVHGLHAAEDAAPITLLRILHAIAATVSAALDTSIEVTCVPENGDFHIAEGERVALALVVNELITNAAKHCESLPRKVAVHLAGGNGEDKAAIVIRNAGRLRHQQSSNGLGLSLVRDLLPAKGVRFTLAEINHFVETRLEIGPPVLRPLPRLEAA